jgi:pimeloyl-ACP methyl ester carboxylesterase
MPLVELPALKLSYEITGASGSHVLLIMGFGFRMAGWKYQVPALAGAHRVIRFDNPGFGGSDTPDRPYRIQDFAARTVELLDALKVDRVHIVGASMGGIIAQQVAVAWPDRVASLALIATHPGGRAAYTPTLRGLMCFIGAQSKNELLRSRMLATMLYTRDYLRSIDRAQLHEALLRDYDRLPLRTFMRRLRAIREHDMRSSLHKLAQTPTVIVRPGRDVLVRPLNSDELHARIPNSRLVRRDDAGHGVIRQCAPFVNDLLLSHFAEVDAQRANRGVDGASMAVDGQRAPG